MSTDAPFSVGASKGLVALTAPLSFVMRNRYTLLIQAVDSASNNATVQLTVNVLEVNKAPYFTKSAYSFSLEEDTPSAILAT